MGAISVCVVISIASAGLSTRASSSVSKEPSACMTSNTAVTTNSSFTQGFTQGFALALQLRPSWASLTAFDMRLCMTGYRCRNWVGILHKRDMYKHYLCRQE
jgi:hypothetical protein